MTNKESVGKMIKGRKILLAAVALAVVLALPMPVQAGPPHKYLHTRGGLIDLTHPEGTDWHELYPVFCTNYTLAGWVDNGDGVLSPCDQILMRQKPDEPVELYHVENVTTTLFLCCECGDFSPPRIVDMYIEYKGGYDPMLFDHLSNTQWHEIRPVFCREWYLYSWADDNLDGILNPGERVYLWQPPDVGTETPCETVEVAVDIVVTPEPPPPPPTPPVGGEAYPVSKASLMAPWIAVGLILAGGISWYVLRRRRARS